MAENISQELAGKSKDYLRTLIFDGSNGNIPGKQNIIMSLSAKENRELLEEILADNDIHGDLFLAAVKKIAENLPRSEVIRKVFHRS